MSFSDLHCAMKRQRDADGGWCIKKLHKDGFAIASQCLIPPFRIQFCRDKEIAEHNFSYLIEQEINYIFSLSLLLLLAHSVMA